MPFRHSAIPLITGLIPTGTGVIGPSGVLTGSTSEGRKHAPSESFQYKKRKNYFNIFALSSNTVIFGDSMVKDFDKSNRSTSEKRRVDKVNYKV